MSLDGTDLDRGLVALACSAAAAGIAAFRTFGTIRNLWYYGAIPALMAVALAMAIWFVVEVETDDPQEDEDTLVLDLDVQYGIGLYMTIAGSAAAIVGAAWQFKNRSTPAPPEF